jgi:hypothetical protein
MVGPGRSWPSPAEGWPAVPFLHGAREMVTEDLARHLTTASEDELGDRSYVWGKRRHFMRPSDKSSCWRPRSEQSGLQLVFEKWDIVEESAHTQTDVETTRSCRSSCRRAGHSRKFCPHREEKKKLLYSLGCYGRAALRREQCEMLIHC